MAGIPIGGGAGMPNIGAGGNLAALQGGQNPLQQIPGMEQLVAKLLELLKAQQGGQGQQQQAGGAQGGQPSGAAPAGGAAGPSAESQGAPGGLEDIMAQILKKLQENPEQAQQILGALPPQLQQALGAALGRGGAGTPSLGGARPGK